MPSFYISRYACTEDQAGLVFRAVRSVRAFHPTAPITVVDDGSDARFPLDALMDADLNLRVVTNAYKGSGEVGTLRAFLTAGAVDEVAVVMHDSMVMRRPLPAGDGNIECDPLFVNPSGGNFRLQGDSPCTAACWLLLAVLLGGPATGGLRRRARRSTGRKPPHLP